MHASITDIDYIHWRSCGEDVLMLIMAEDLLSYNRERLKKITLASLAQYRIHVIHALFMHNLSFVYALSLYQ